MAQAKETQRTGFECPFERPKPGADCDGDNAPDTGSLEVKWRLSLDFGKFSLDRGPNIREG